MLLAVRPVAGQGADAMRFAIVPVADAYVECDWDVVEARLLNEQRWPGGSDAQAARRLVALLWEDCGEPGLNYYNQWLVLTAISHTAGGFDADGRRALREGLVRYWHGGGMQIAQDFYRGSSFVQALVAIGEGAEAEVKDVVWDATLALAHADIGFFRAHDAPEVAASGMDPLALLQLAEQQMAATAEGVCRLLGIPESSEDWAAIHQLYTQSIGQTRDTLLGWAERQEWETMTGELRGDGPAGAAAEAPSLSTLRSELRKLVRERGDAERVRRVVELCRAIQAPRAQADAWRNVLRCFRRVAASRHTSADVLAALERELVELSDLAVKRASLTTVWAHAAAALAPRSSPRLLKCANRLRPQVNDPRARAALDVARERLQRIHHRHEPPRSGKDGRRPRP